MPLDCHTTTRFNTAHVLVAHRRIDHCSTDKPPPPAAMKLVRELLEVIEFWYFVSHHTFQRTAPVARTANGMHVLKFQKMRGLDNGKHPTFHSSRALMPPDAPTLSSDAQSPGNNRIIRASFHTLNAARISAQYTCANAPTHLNLQIHHSPP